MAITVWKAKNGWKQSDEVLIAIDGNAGNIIFVSKKEGGFLHFESESTRGPQIADVDWTPERMGEKKIPRVIIWDEICTVPRPILERFLNWLDLKGRQVICCGDPGQPQPIGGEMPHDWLRKQVDYYEEVEVDHRAKDDTLKVLKKSIRLKSDEVQCQEMRKAFPSCLKWDRFVKAWKPSDLILISRKGTRNRTQELLFSGRPSASPLPSKGHSKTEHHGRHTRY